MSEMKEKTTVNESAHPPQRQWTAGILLILIGGWFLLDTLGLNLPGIGALWPVFLIIGGLMFIARYLGGSEPDAGILIPGIGGFLIGIFFLLFTFDALAWSDMDRYWPAFPVLGGIAFIAVFIAGTEKDGGLLIPGVGGLLVGGFFFLFSLGRLPWSDLARWWPGFLIIGAITFFAAWLLGRPRERGLLIPAGFGLAGGLVLMAFTLGGADLSWLARWWPVGLILLGLGYLIQGLWQRRQ